MTISAGDIEVIKKAVQEAVDQVCLRLGIDPAEEGALSTMRADLAYAHRMRVASETISSAGIWTLVGLVLTGIGAAAWLGIQMVFTGHTGGSG